MKYESFINVKLTLNELPVEYKSWWAEKSLNETKRESREAQSLFIPLSSFAASRTTTSTKLLRRTFQHKQSYKLGDDTFLLFDIKVKQNKERREEKCEKCNQGTCSKSNCSESHWQELSLLFAVNSRNTDWKKTRKRKVMQRHAAAPRVDLGLL